MQQLHPAMASNCAPIRCWPVPLPLRGELALAPAAWAISSRHRAARTGLHHRACGTAVVIERSLTKIVLRQRAFSLVAIGVIAPGTRHINRVAAIAFPTKSAPNGNLHRVCSHDDGLARLLALLPNARTLYPSCPARATRLTALVGREPGLRPW